MSARILDGKTLAEQIKKQLKDEVGIICNETGCAPLVVNVMIGDSHAACAYANAQKKAADYIGIQYRQDILDENIPVEGFISHIQELNEDKKVHGLLIQRPVPGHIDYYAAANRVDVLKDLEGINIVNIGKMLLGETKMIPCTPAAALEHIKSTGLELRGKEVVIVGHSEIVGKPLSLLLLREMATVTICHIGTSEAGRLAEHVARADILVVAVGQPGLIKGEWVKKGAVVIDIGINRVDDKIVGDVEFDTAQQRAAYITPVPGGVGPVTVVMLMKNVIEAFRIQNKKGLR